MHTTWLGSLLGTRRAGLAPLDLLLLATLLVVLIVGATQHFLLPHAVDRETLCPIDAVDPIIQWDGVPARESETYSFTDPLETPPSNGVVWAIMDQSGTSVSYQFDDGELHVGDRLVSVRSHGSRWVHLARLAAGGYWYVTGWTLVIQHKDQVRTLHLTNPTPIPGC